MSGDPDPPATTLDGIVITSALERRPARAPNHADESHALQRLAQLFADDPDALLQRLLDVARELCAADASGVTLLEHLPDDRPVFRWVAASGSLAAHVGSMKPRNFSPCGLCLDRGSPQLFKLPLVTIHTSSR